MATLKDKREELEHKQQALADIFDKAKAKGKGQYDFANLDDPFFRGAKTTRERLDLIHEAEAEKLSKAEKQYETVNERLTKSEKQILHPSSDEKKANVSQSFKSLGEMVAKSKEYENWSKRGEQSCILGL